MSHHLKVGVEFICNMVVYRLATVSQSVRPIINQRTKFETPCGELNQTFYAAPLGHPIANSRVPVIGLRGRGLIRLCPSGHTERVAVKDATPWFM
jgi:hypothetical protein